MFDRIYTRHRMLHSFQSEPQVSIMSSRPTYQTEKKNLTLLTHQYREQALKHASALFACCIKDHSFDLHRPLILC